MRSTLEPSRLHDAVVVKARSRLIVEVLVLRYVLGALVEKSRIQNDIRHELNHLLLLQLRCNRGTEINLHWSGPRALLASTLSLHRSFLCQVQKHLSVMGVSVSVSLSSD